VPLPERLPTTGAWSSAPRRPVGTVVGRIPAARPSRSRAPLGVLVAAGEEGVGASVTAALLAREARDHGARVLLVGPQLRAQRLAALFGVALPGPDFPPVVVERDIEVADRVPSITDADVILLVPGAHVPQLLDAIDELAARTAPAKSVVLAPGGGASLAATFAVLKLLVGRRPQCAATVLPWGDADVTPLRDAAERWLGRPLPTAPALPIDPTLPVALRAGIPLAEAVADTALTTAAGALWTALSTSASTGVLS